MSNQHADKTLEKLRSYLVSDEGEVYLTDKEEDLLKMVQMAHDLFQSRKYDSWQISRLISKCWGCSIGTAQMVMRDAQILFGAKACYDRNYMATLHLDEIIKDKIEARERGDFAMVLELHKIQNKAIELLPEEIGDKDVTPAAIHFHVVTNNINAPATNVLLDEAQQLLSNMKIQDAQIIEK